jgi:hypothetical protein
LTALAGGNVALLEQAAEQLGAGRRLGYAVRLVVVVVEQCVGLLGLGGKLA